MFRTLSVAFSCLVLSGCVSQPDIYAPPAQRKPLDRELLVREQPLLEMGDPNIDANLVSDILKGPQPAPWRWARKRPTIAVALKSVSNLKYHIDLTIPDITFKDTGPVTITFFVNDRPIDSVRYDTPGNKTFEKLVPAGLLKEMSENRLAAEIDKTYTPKGDTLPLGFIISRFGLVQ